MPPVGRNFCAEPCLTRGAEAVEYIARRVSASDRGPVGPSCVLRIPPKAALLVAARVRSRLGLGKKKGS